MLWTSIATGKMACRHGVPGFTEVDPGTGAVVLVSAATRTRNVVAVYDRAVDEIGELFMPYHPPRMEEILEADFDLSAQARCSKIF